MKKLFILACILLLTSCVPGYIVETRYARPYSYTVISVAPSNYNYRRYTPIRIGHTRIYYRSVPSEEINNLK